MNQAYQHTELNYIQKQNLDSIIHDTFKAGEGTCKLGEWDFLGECLFLLAGEEKKSEATSKVQLKSKRLKSTTAANPEI